MQNPIRTATRPVIHLWAFLFLAISAAAEEGMWQPHQLPNLSEELRELGLSRDPEDLASLDSFPMNAIVSLGGCSASFVSPQGLVATNHHCVYSSIQYNSTPENNLLENGFLAGEREAEVPAAPGTRIYVTESLTDVTDQVLQGVDETTGGLNRYQTIEDNRKTLIRQCESSDVHRCDVAPFHHGLSYYLIKRLEIRDVRLVYAPASSVGRYGGDEDNWQWPRHTGDFGFYRAYVGPDGQPAEQSEENVPYEPESHLPIAASGLESGEFVMAAGYPGSTNRYRTADEVQSQFEWYYPNARQLRLDLIEVIRDSSAPDSQARLNYESTIASLSNYAKNYRSMVESYRRGDLLDERRQLEADFLDWIESDPDRRESYRPAVESLQAVVDRVQQSRERDLILDYFNYADLPNTAARLYRWAVEQQKPDAEREPGYQDRDRDRFRQALQRLSRNYDNEVDRGILFHLLQNYARLPAGQRVDALDEFFGIGETLDEQSLRQQLEAYYRDSELDKEGIRLQWMEASPEAFRDSDDPMIRYAVATHDARMALEDEEKDIQGEMQRWRSQYMAGLIAYYQNQGQPIYADANGTLRVTYGQVQGNEPRDGLRNLPFTTLEGILEKHRGEEPFDAPAEQRSLIRQREYGPYELEDLDSVPVNFLSDVDITGGNSGSAIMNGDAELVGLLFDGVYQSIIGDWDFDPQKNRAIAVDARYMLWVMENLDGADNLIEELDIRK